MQLTILRSWKQVLEGIGHDFASRWRWLKTIGKGLWPWRGDQECDSVSIVAPHLEIRDGEKEIAIWADMPGLKRNDFSVEIEDRFLTLRGERSSSHEEKNTGFYYSEQSYGSFSRTIPLPCKVDGSKAKAKYSHGRLKLTLPKAAGGSRARRIEISN